MQGGNIGDDLINCVKKTKRTEQLKLDKRKKEYRKWKKLLLLGDVMGIAYLHLLLCVNKKKKPKKLKLDLKKRKECNYLWTGEVLG